MICHQGSARASPRLRQALPAAKGLSPRADAHAFRPASHPQKPHGTPAHPPHRFCAPRQHRGSPPGGHCHRHLLPGVITQAWDIGKTSSIPPPPRHQRRVWEGGRGLAGNRQRRCRGLPDKPRQPRHEAPALFPKRFRSRESKACQDASRPASSRSRTHRGWCI